MRSDMARFTNKLPVQSVHVNSTSGGAAFAPGGGSKMQAAFGMGPLFGDTSASLSAQTRADFSSEGGLLQDDHGPCTKIPRG
jgi:hypothetical protein